MGKKLTGAKLRSVVDQGNTAPSRGVLLTKLYGRHIPESLADNVCYPEDGIHHHLWYEVKMATKQVTQPIILELHCSCGKVIKYGGSYYSELLLQILEDLEAAIDINQLKEIKAGIPLKVFEDAWDLASDSIKRHCHSLAKS